jgi:hypothetical protein
VFSAGEVRGHDGDAVAVFTHAGFEEFDPRRGLIKQPGATPPENWAAGFDPEGVAYYGNTGIARSRSGIKAQY